MTGVVVVGSSVAGVRTAQALRAQDHQGRIVVVGREDHLPYDKPPLSKQLLAGEWPEKRAALLSTEAADRDRIELRLGTEATGLDLARRQVHLADGESLDYDDAVLATGADARPSPWPGLPGVHVLRTLDDLRALRRDLQRGGPLVVVGGGFIGTEVAATAVGLGLGVTVVDPLPAPVTALLGDLVGGELAALHRRRGVDTRFGTGVQSIEPGGEGGLLVRLSDGSSLPAATVVVGIGAVPNDGWLRGSGLDVDDGVLCDDHGRALGAEHVYAVGDVARWHDGERHRRVEHWTNAVEQAAVVAHTITHPDASPAHRPSGYVWTDQHDWRMQVVGDPVGCEEPRIVGSFEDDRPRVAALFARGDRLRGAVVVNWPKAMLTCRRLLAGEPTVAEAEEALAALVTGAARRP